MLAHYTCSTAYLIVDIPCLVLLLLKGGKLRPTLKAELTRLVSVYGLSVNAKQTEIKY